MRASHISGNVFDVSANVTGRRKTVRDAPGNPINSTSQFHLSGDYGSDRGGGQKGGRKSKSVLRSKKRSKSIARDSHKEGLDARRSTLPIVGPQQVIGPQGGFLFPVMMPPGKGGQPGAMANG